MFRQPRVPEMSASGGWQGNVRSLVLFLKDFCMDAWSADREKERRLRELEKRIAALESEGK